MPLILGRRRLISVILLRYFLGGGGLNNQINKVAIVVDTSCLASDNSGSETNAQGMIAKFSLSNPSSVVCHNYVSFSVLVDF